MPDLTKHNDIRDMLLDAGGLSPDRLPMLQVIFERLATLYTDGLRHLASSPSYFSLSGMENGRIGEIAETYEAKAVVGIFHAPKWDSQILVGFDRAFVFSMLEALFGADGSEPPVDDERSFSVIELRIAQTLFELAGHALQASFALVSDTPFKFERLETRMEFAMAGRRNSMSVAAKLRFEALDRGGEMFVIVPHSALTPMRQALSRAASGEPNAGDPNWTRQIRTELRKTTVSLRAVLEERTITLGEVADLKVGQVLQLQASSQSRVKLEGSEQPLFWCELGQSDGIYNLRIEDVSDHEQEFMNDLLSR